MQFSGCSLQETLNSINIRDTVSEESKTPKSKHTKISV